MVGQDDNKSKQAERNGNTCDLAQSTLQTFLEVSIVHCGRQDFQIHQKTELQQVHIRVADKSLMNPGRDSFIDQDSKLDLWARHYHCVQWRMSGRGHIV